MLLLLRENVIFYAEWPFETLHFPSALELLGVYIYPDTDLFTSRLNNHFLKHVSYKPDDPAAGAVRYFDNFMDWHEIPCIPPPPPSPL